MALTDEPKADLMELAKSLQSVAKALKGLSADHPQFLNILDVLGKEVMSVSAQIRKK